MNASFTKPVVSSRLPVALAVCVVFLSACSGGSGSGSAPLDSGTNESNVATVPVNDGAVNDGSGQVADNMPSEPQPQTPVADNSGGSNPVKTEGSEPTPSEPAPVVPAPIEPIATRVEFNVMVPAYVSNSLQVQVSWGDVQLSAAWVVDETWSVSSDFPSDTENLLSVNYTDGNGAVVLGSYETNFRTSASPTQTVEIFADQFDTASHDADGDGMSNLDEALAGTDPLATPPPENTVRVDFDITVPVISSDSLQVRLEWGDKVFFASWVGDENWSAFADFPVDTREALTVTFLDRNGDLPLAIYSTFYRTNNDAQNLQFSANRFSTHRFDEDLDGVSNYREKIAGTDPLVSDSSVPVTFSSVADNFTQRCSRCHSRFSNADGQLYERLLTINSYVVPFEPENSRVPQKLEGSMYWYSGDDMRELIRAWILLGALEN